MGRNISYEQILWEGLKEGNQKIFDYLFHYYYSGLVVFSFSYVDDMNTAEDLVQDFFFNLWLNREKINIHQSIKSYFFSAVKNRSLDFLKHRKVGIRIVNEMKYMQLNAKEEPDFFVESELDKQIKEALGKLPEKCRKIFLMNRFDGVKPEKIAKEENISIRTVEGHIGKAIKILRTELKPHFPAFAIMLLIIWISFISGFMID